MARQDPEKERLRSADSRNNLEGRSLWAGSLSTTRTSCSLEPKVTLESHTRAGTHPSPPCPGRHSLATRASARRCQVKNKPVLPAHCCTTSCQGREPRAGQQDTHCRKQDLRGGPQPAGRGKPGSRPEPQLRLQKPPRAWKPTFSRDNLRSASCLTASGPTRLPSFAGWFCGVALRGGLGGGPAATAGRQAGVGGRRAAQGRAQPCGPRERGQH